VEEEGRPLERRLRRATLFARERVYHAGEPTPLDHLNLPGEEMELWVKREDLGPIKAYKWRGSYNRMAIIAAEQPDAAAVTASAGNHAQGVALAARKLGMNARIYMPRTTPRVKIAAVQAQTPSRPISEPPSGGPVAAGPETSCEEWPPARRFGLTRTTVLVKTH